MILFWFLLVALALAWGIADWQQDQLAHRAPPPVVQKSAPTVAAAQASLASPAPAAAQDGAAAPVIDPTAAAKPVAADSEPPKADEPK
jgi:hypothetical protein